MTPSEACETLVKACEGLELQAYPDPGTGRSPWTIGYGHTGSDVKPGLAWTPDRAEAALALDLSRVGAGVASLIDGTRTTQSMFDALTSFAYNVGLSNLASSSLLKKHKAGDYEGAKAEFARWNKANGKVMSGLTRRRAIEAAMYGRQT